MMKEYIVTLTKTAHIEAKSRLEAEQKGLDALNEELCSTELNIEEE